MTKVRFIEPAEYPVSLSYQREKRKKRGKREIKITETNERVMSREKEIYASTFMLVSLFMSLLWTHCPNYIMNLLLCCILEHAHTAQERLFNLLEMKVSFC